MGNKAAARPKFSLAQLIDRRLDVDRQIEELNVLKAQYAEQIVAEMKASEQTRALGTQGKGYQLVSSLKAEYKPEAVQYAEKARLVHLFTPPPKITRSKVLAALKADQITQTQYSALEAFAGPTFTEHTLKTFVEKA